MSFEKSLSVASDLEDEINKVARAISLNILGGLTKLTPVDTGRARGNWFVGVNSSNRSVDANRRVTSAITDGSSKIAGAKALKYPEIVLSNNLPYIERLNDGYSMQAPKKFVETEINRVVNASNFEGVIVS